MCMCVFLQIEKRRRIGVRTHDGCGAVEGQSAVVVWAAEAIDRCDVSITKGRI